MCARNQNYSILRSSLLLADERPYRCTLCGQSFRESGALTRHLKSLTPCTEKIRFVQYKEILVSKDGVQKGQTNFKGKEMQCSHCTVASIYTSNNSYIHSTSIHRSICPYIRPQFIHSSSLLSDCLFLFSTVIHLEIIFLSITIFCRFPF